MKRLLFIVAAMSVSSAFPLTQEEIRDNVTGCYIYSYNSDHSVSSCYFQGTLSSVESHFKLSDIAVECSSNYCIYPDFSDLSYSSTNLYSSSTPVRSVEVNFVKYAPVNCFPRVYTVYNFAVSLFCAGYRGAGFTLFEYTNTNQTRARFNFNYSLAVADIASSTNLVFHQLLISHLSSIQSAIVSIDSGVSSLSPRLDSIADINSHILSNTQEAVSSFGFQSSNLVLVAEGVSRLGDSFEYFSPVWSFERLSNFVESASNPLYNGVSLDTDGISWDIDPSNHDLNSPRGVARYENIVDQYCRSFPYLNALFGASRILSPNSYGLSGLGDSLNQSILEVLGTSGSDILDPASNTRFLKSGARDSKVGGRGISGDTRTIKLELQDWKSKALSDLAQWKEDLSKQLQDWKTSDERGILNIRKTIEDNFMSDDPRIPGHSNTVPFTVYVTNTVTRPITNVVSDSARGISSNVVEQSRKTRDFFDEKLFDPNAPGVNVRVVYPIYGEDVRAINVHDTALDAFGATFDALDANLQDFDRSVSDKWDQWFSKWSNWEFEWYNRFDSYADISTNLFASFNDSRPVADLASRFLENGFDEGEYNSLPWFSRVEVLLAMIADVRSNSVEVADIRDEMEEQAANFHNLSTNVVSASSDVVGLFDYVRRFSAIFETMFSDKAAPLTGDYVLLPAGSWIGDSPLVLRVNPTIQNLCRLIMQCIWYLGFLVLLWVVVQWCWSKVVAVLRWLWSMFDV